MFIIFIFDVLFEHKGFNAKFIFTHTQKHTLSLSLFYEDRKLKLTSVDGCVFDYFSLNVEKIPFLVYS
jgi:hypothetical protein